MPARTPLRRTVTAVAAAAALTAGTALAVDAPASADPRPSSSTIVSGDARFEVLSPTLIRAEYSADGQFTDEPTFNAIGRDAFTPVAFHHTESDGWLTITTGKATLKYKVGSGRFTADNLELDETAGQQDVTAAPWAGQSAPTCTVGTRCEAEDLLLSGVGINSDHGGYSGTGFASGFESTGNSVTFTSTVAADGDYDLALRYANHKEIAGQQLSVVVDGGEPQAVPLPDTGSWDTWDVTRTTTPVHLTAGEHTVSLVRTATDIGSLNVDNLAVVPTGADYPGPGTAPAAPDCGYGTVCQGEAGTLSGGATSATDHNGYAGKGFLAGLNAGANATFHVTGVPADGTYDLQLRYASGTGATRPVSIKANQSDPTSADLPGTSNWDSWRIVSIPVVLKTGANDVAVQCPDAGSCGVNIDSVAVTTAGGPLLAPHAPLGGYRRGLDGVDGAASTTPGLLYQDGWYLLDDTTSDVFDSTAHTVTPRPDHGGRAYQDGYVFAYGQDYARGLKDLATLTGPSELLPRWAYGVWYSEYFNHSAADYENTILPKFRADKVPLDAMVTDTDFKAPDPWDGWEMNSTQFPDPAGYFAWAHKNGLHTSLNIHPSVLDSDPKYDDAQATADNKLTQNNAGCYSDGGHQANCYVFDWSDPKQLQAYFDLHDEIKHDGNDIWWLDWCCEQSVSSATGVTPDAWINQNYKWYTDDTQGRGFALSRAFGSLQAGGYSGQQGLATGPWADKRTTAHFTGDTTSSWGTLAMEVGYTPGESASTGLSAVSHDIGGFNSGPGDTSGAEPGTKKLPDDLYARWVQLGAFQPILRLHGNHSDRLPWQYGTDAKNSAEKFLNLREDLVPYTYTLAQQATKTGVPVTRPLYLQYPGSQEAYANAGSEYLYGPDLLVAPVTKQGMGSVDTQVWFPPGNTWTDWFTGKTYAGGTTATVSTTLATMPVFVKSGGIVTTRSENVTNDEQNPLDKATVSVATGANGSSSLYEDNGTTTDTATSATTAIDYTEAKGVHGVHTLHIAAAKGRFAGQVAKRQWTARFTGTVAPKSVSVDGVKLAPSGWKYDAATRTVTVTVPARPVGTPTTVSYTTRNTAPTAPAVSVRTTVATPVSITLRGSDPDRDRLTYTHTRPAHGTVTGSGAALRYTSTRTFAGVDRFSYTVSDPFGGRVTRTVTVTVGRLTPAVSVSVSPRKPTTRSSVVVSVRVRIAHGVSARSATVTVTQGGKTLAHGHLGGTGVRKLRLPHLRRGTHGLVVTVGGTSVTTKVTKRVTVRVR